MENDNDYLLTLAAIAKEIQQRGEKRECAVNLGAGMPLTGFGREESVPGISAPFFPAGKLQV